MSKFFPCSSNKDLYVINTFFILVYLLILFIYLFLFIIIFLNAQKSTKIKFAIDTNFVTYCLNYFVSGMPFEGLANSNVYESVMKRNMARCFCL